MAWHSRNHLEEMTAPDSFCPGKAPEEDDCAQWLVIWLRGLRPEPVGREREKGSHG
ncbi:hypothetical protein GCM10009863_19080 [Streptomyces axinellae]|uniref:Uncharacterized protein n=1 Tax=Streptomyces axinellae TaxID=552788 RepID=A0ABP6C7A3_9ACTN